jgi:uncharacterized damage-inducible protein DinB
MADNIRVQTLVKTYEMMRNLSKFYISKLSGLDLKMEYEIDGTKLNSAYWLIAHLVWTEHYLIIEGIGGESMGIEWLNDFAIGSSLDDLKNGPKIEEILAKLDEVHKKAIEILNNMTDEQLQAENNIEANFGGQRSKENVLMHAIRHEPMHIGQISWILKANGVSLV